MSQLTEYDLRQIILAKGKIDLFKKKLITMKSLFSNLFAILNALTLSKSLWKDQIRKEVNTLELIYDSIEDESIARWEKDADNTLNKSVDTLDILFSKEIEKYFRYPQSSVLKKAKSLDDTWLMCPECAESWESMSKNAMVICPKCASILHNPFYQAKI